MSVEVHVEGAASLKAGACRVIAEAGANHNNSVERAIEMAQAAQRAGAWAIKYQLYKADTISVPDSPKYWTDPFGTKTQYEAFQLSDKLDYAEFKEIADACRLLDILFFATPFDFDAVAELERINAPLYKVASADITHRPLLEAIAATGKPVLLSTGAATLEEVHAAIEWLGPPTERIVPLVCTLTYPTPDADANFARLEEFRRTFAPRLVGFSDHTLGTDGAYMTAALGGVCIEKHYTLDKSLPDVPDHAMSVTPDELATMVRACNRGSVLRGEEWIGVRESERPARELARRSIILAQDVDSATPLEVGHLSFKRPGNGLSPNVVGEVLGRSLREPLTAGHLLGLGDLQNSTEAD